MEANRRHHHVRFRRRRSPDYLSNHLYEGGRLSEPSPYFCVSICLFDGWQKMFSLAIWFLTLAVEGLLLVRAVTGGFLRKYILFYSYLGWVLALSSVRLIIYIAQPAYYRDFYWNTQPFSVLMGCALVWEIYRQALRRYPGAARMACNLLLFLLLMVTSKLLVNAWNGSVRWQAKTTAELERNMRTVQGILLIALILVLAHYAIPLGRNLKGMILGYGLFISTSVIDLTLRLLLGDSFQKSWQYLQPMFYLAALTIWGLTLWSYQSAPLPATEPRIEADYRILATRTRKRIFQVRAYLARAIRP